MSEGLFKTLNEMARDAGVSRSEFVRNLIQDKWTEIEKSRLQDPCPHNLNPLEITRGDHGETLYRCPDCGAEFEQVIPW
jgi:hypothetical protein